jgi:plastocyanin
MSSTRCIALSAFFCHLYGCGSPAPKQQPSASQETAPRYFKVDPQTAGVVKGTIHYTGRKLVLKPIDMSNDPACAEAHRGKAVDDSIVAASDGSLANVFVYIKSGLENKQFETPQTAVAIDQHGCWFEPRVLGIQVGQTLRISNADPVTHNIHPLAQVNREWNHSMGAGDPPIDRRFPRPEVMIPVKCNIHSWMHAYIGVLPHPYFAVSALNGTFAIDNVPPGDYVIEAWQEKLGSLEQKVTVTPKSANEVSFTYKGDSP